MKLRFLSIFSFFLLISGCATETKYQVKKPFLYEVTKGDRKAYLFGTMHVGVVMEDLPDSFWPYFNQSDIVVTEVDLDDDQLAPGNVAFHHLLKRMIRTEGDPKISEVLSKDDCEDIFRASKDALGLSNVQDLDKFSLFGIYSLLMLRDQEGYQEESRLTHGEHVRFSQKFTLDQRLLEKATSEQNKVMDTLDNLNSETLWNCYVGETKQQIEDIRKLLHKSKTVSEVSQILRMAEQYRAGDESVISEQLDLIPDCVLKERNASWMVDILSILQNYKRPFFAVGAGHIVAKKDSLIHLLQDRGYSVRRMTETFLPEEK